MRSPAAWQTWFKRRGTKFLDDVLAAKAQRAPGASTQLDDEETSKSQSQNDANGTRPDNDQTCGNEDADAIVEYLLANPCESDESLAAYWEGFQTSVGLLVHH